jgi:vacuolar-type H+-ATPase subunit H
MNKNQTKKSEKVLSRTLPDGTILESLYDPKKEAASLLVYRPGQENIITNEYEDSGKSYAPMLNKDISRGVVLLPSKYESPGTFEQLFLDVKEAIHKYVELEDEVAENLATRYVMMSWIYDEFHSIPYLRIMGPYGTGKSRFLDVIAALSYHSTMIGVAVTPANIFRLQEKYKGTLFIDEAHFGYLRKRSPILQILNAGYKQGTYVTRTEQTKNGNMPRTFDPFGPKILAAQESFSEDSLESRIISLSSVIKSRDIPLSIPHLSQWDEMIHLRNRLLGYRITYKMWYGNDYQVQGLEKFEPRMTEILYPLLLTTREKSIPEDIREFAKELRKERIAQASMDDGVIVAKALIEAFSVTQHPIVKNIADRANKISDGKSNLSAKRAGFIIRSLGFKTRRSRDGYRVYGTPRKIRALEKRYRVFLED